LAKKRKYIDVNLPQQWEPYLKEALAKPEVQKNLELVNQTKTYSGLGAWIIREYLVDNTSFRLQHLNTKEHHITIIDNKLRTTVDVYPKKPNELWCEYDQSNSCNHVVYALTLTEVRKVLTAKGWKLPDV
jgi:hypothetical protein